MTAQRSPLQGGQKGARARPITLTLIKHMEKHLSANKKIPQGMTVEYFGKFASEFKKETDRAAVILGAAQLDLALFQLLDAHFLPVTSGKDELLDGDSPLATFSARINICYRIGLIDAEVARALHLARRIRNSFAHEVSSASLDSGSNRDRIRELISPFAQNWALQTLIEKYFDGHETPGAQFRACIALLSLRIDGAVEIAKRVDSSRAMRILPPDKVSEVEADPSMSAPEAAT